MTAADLAMTTADGSGRLDSAVWKAAGVAVLGSVMAILDSTLVNVLLQKLTIDFHTSLATTQWVVTGYLLATATVVPVTAWACDRFGTTRVYLLAIAVFLAGSVLAGAAWSIGSLIVFRVVQGLGGGMLGPAATTIVVRAAGPQRVGRMMAVLGVPVLLGPISGPILGGWLTDLASWRWAFFVNVPVGVLAFVLARRVLPEDGKQPAHRFDLAGLLLLSPGLALLIFAAFLAAGGLGPAVVGVPGVLGVLGITGFLVRGTRISHPLIDLSLFRDRTFGTSVTALSLFVFGFFGSSLLFPTYFLLVRGESTLDTGLLLLPGGIGAMLSIPVCGQLADKLGAGRVVVPGLVLILAALAVFTRVGARTPYPVLLLAQFVLGVGLGATLIPLMSAAVQRLATSKAAAASTALNIAQQAFGAVGTATMSIVLARELAARFHVPTAQGQLAATDAVADPRTHDTATAAAADAFGTAFGWALVLIAVCLVPAALLLGRFAVPGRHRRPARYGRYARHAVPRRTPAVPPPVLPGRPI
jgi:EmrB/QacA subfamily drug resistance transporter